MEQNIHQYLPVVIIAMIIINNDNNNNNNNKMLQVVYTHAQEVTACTAVHITIIYM